MRRYDIVKTACKAKGTNISQLERDLGFSKGYISKIDNHRPSAEKMQQIATYLDIPLNDLILGKEMPVYECAGGEGRINDCYPDETIKLDSANCDGTDYGFIKIRGDSMYPDLKDGDVVRVHFQAETSPSDYTVVKINGNEETIKHIEIVDNGVWIRAVNKAVFDDRFYSIQEVMSLPITIVGKATEIVYREI